MLSTVEPPLPTSKSGTPMTLPRPTTVTVFVDEINPQVSNGNDVSLENAAGLSSSHSKDQLKGFPWWKRPSPWWLLVTAHLLNVAFSAMMAPRIELYTRVACQEHRPDVEDLNFASLNAALGLSADRNTSNMTRNSLLDYALDHRPLLPVFPLPQVADELDLDGQLPCTPDPAIQTAAAKLVAAITTTIGILACLTTGFWGSFSDRYGRTRVMGISLIGSLLGDIIYISVVRFFKVIPGRSWFLLFAAVIEGSLGGMAVGELSMYSYMADVTDQSSRCHYFALTTGFMLVGLAVGPTLGSMLIASTGKFTSVFYFVGTLHVFLAFWAFFILPESVSREQRQQFKEKYLQQPLGSLLEREDQTIHVGLCSHLKTFFPFLKPLAVFLPYQEETKNLSKKTDWSLTLLTLGYGITVAIVGCYPFKLQYAAATFHWDSVDLGYYISLVGLTSGLFLTVLFPIVTKFLRPKLEIVKVLDSSSNPPSIIQKEVYSSSFDLSVVKVLLTISITVYCLIGLNTTALGFTVLGMINSAGLGISPVMQSVALALYTRQGGTEVGQLFGGLGVVSAICAQFFGPFVYGVIYVKTVTSYPPALFFAFAASLGLALVLVALIRIPKDIPGEDLEEAEPLLSSESRNNQPTIPTYGAT